MVAAAVTPECKSRQPFSSCLFTAQRENDSESSLMHFRARSYDPRLGRLVQIDPSPESRLHEHYGYARNLPTTRSDPTGRQTESTILEKPKAGKRGIIRFDVDLWFEWPELWDTPANFIAGKDAVKSFVDYARQSWKTMLSQWIVRPYSLYKVPAIPEDLSGDYDVELGIHYGFTPMGQKIDRKVITKTGWHYVELKPLKARFGGSEPMAWDVRVHGGVAKGTGIALEGIWRTDKKGIDATHEVGHSLGLDEGYLRGAAGVPVRVTAKMETGSYAQGYSEFWTGTIMGVAGSWREELNKMQMELMLGYYKPGGIMTWKAKPRD